MTGGRNDTQQLWDDLRDIITRHTNLRGAVILADLLDRMEQDSDVAMRLITRGHKESPDA